MFFKLRSAGMAVLLAAASVTPLLAQSAPLKVQAGKREILLQTSQSWNGKPYIHYPTGQVELTTLKVTLAPTRFSLRSRTGLSMPWRRSTTASA